MIDLGDRYLPNLPLGLKAGQFVGVVSDQGPTGTTGQCMSITCPWMKIVIADDLQELKDALGKVRAGVSLRTHIQCLGDYGTGRMFLEDLRIRATGGRDI